MESSQGSKHIEISNEILHPEIDTCISIERYSFVCLQRIGATEGEVSPTRPMSWYSLACVPKVIWREMEGTPKSEKLASVSFLPTI
jgi:hypothetical protein